MLQDTEHRITDAEDFRPPFTAASRNGGEKLVKARNRSREACQQTHQSALMRSRQLDR